MTDQRHTTIRGAAGGGGLVEANRVRSRILVPVGVALAVLLTSFLVWHRSHEASQLSSETALLAGQAERAWDQLLAFNADMLEEEHIHMCDFLSRIEAVWHARDREALLAASRGLLDRANANHATTHFYFVEPDRTCFLRVHNPPRHGDVIDRGTMLDAERTGDDAWGVELGPLGTFTLRYVRPWKVDGELIAYVELGMEVERIAGQMADLLGSDLVTVLHKSATTREKFAKGKTALGLSGDWDRFAEIVVVNQTIEQVPLELESAPFALDGEAHSEVFELSRDGREWSCVAVPIADVRGRHVADLVVMRDVTAAHAALLRQYAMIGGLVAGAGMLLMLALSGLLGRIQRQLTAAAEGRERALHDMEERAKELRCLHGVAESIRKCSTLEDLFQDTAGFLPPTWRLSEIARGRVHFDSKDYVSEPFQRTTWRQTSDIIVAGERRGFVEVCYLEQRPDLDEGPFLKEERNLIDSIAHTLSEAAERQQAEAAVAARTAELEQRTVELEKSRRAAMSMMEDAKQARKVAEAAREELRDNEERQRVILDTIQAGVVVVDEEGHTIVDANPAALTMIGASKEEVVGRVCHEYICPAEVGRCPISDLGQEVDNSERVLVRADGRTIPVLKTVTRVMLNGRRHLLDSFVDISALKQTEEALAKSEQKFMDIFYSSADATLLIDGETFVDCNEKTVQMLRASNKQEVLATHPSELSPDTQPDGRSSFEKANEMIATTYERGSNRFEWDHRRMDGEVFPVEVTLMPVPLFGKQVLYCMWKDISELVEARTAAELTEKELRESNAMMVDALEREKRSAAMLEATMEQLEDAKEAAEAATRSKSEFLANMSHEIRTPMTAILGFTETMLDRDISDSDRLNAVHTVRRNGEHLLQIINDILDISKIEAGKLEVERIECSPVRVVADVKSLMQVRADAKNLPFNIEYTGTVPETIQSDPTRLKQILVNLIGNAIKFTETGGVRLVTRSVDDGAKPNMQFDVVDTGLGMTKEQVGKLFQAFTQADTTTTRKFGGTGLGLMISKRLAEMLGGDITVTSEHGKGSTFRITVTTGSLDGVKMIADPLSATAVTPDETAAVPSSDQPALAGCRILLAEDGPDNQRLIAHLLKKAGAEVTVKDNGKLAAEAALPARDEGNPFDVILMDMQMPVMDGYEATGLLRQKGYTAPIIALTAHAMASDRQKCIDAGCDDYGSKPIDRKKLIETIRNNLLRAAPTSVGEPPGAAEAETSVTPANNAAVGAGEAVAGSEMGGGSIVSNLANNPDMAELIEQFVGRMPKRIEALEEALAEQDVQALGELAHKLKGAAGGYGFPSISAAAGTLEDSAKAAESLDKLEGEARALVQLCRGARASVVEVGHA